MREEREERGRERRKHRMQTSVTSRRNFSATVCTYTISTPSTVLPHNISPPHTSHHPSLHTTSQHTHQICSSVMSSHCKQPVDGYHQQTDHRPRIHLDASLASLSIHTSDDSNEEVQHGHDTDDNKWGQSTPPN